MQPNLPRQQHLICPLTSLVLTQQQTAKAIDLKLRYRQLVKNERQCRYYKMPTSFRSLLAKQQQVRPQLGVEGNVPFVVDMLSIFFLLMIVNICLYDCAS